MARRHERIEPTFDGPEGDDDFHVSADDRAVPMATNDARRKLRNKGKSVV